MSANECDRLKALLGVMVRRHARHTGPEGATTPMAADSASHRVARLIAAEASKVQNPSQSSRDDELVDRLYRRFLLPRQSTVATDASV